MSWERTIRTGSYATDQQALAHCEAEARAQGLTLQSTQLPDGGYHVRAAPAGYASAPPPNPYGQSQGPNPYGAPPQQYGSAPPPAGYGAPSPYGGAPPGPSPYGAPSGVPFNNPYAAPAGGFGSPAYGAGAGVRYTGGGGSCDCCGVSGPTKHRTFMQNIGMLVIRFPSTRSGSMCRRCIDQYFWQYTLVTGFFGWWGMISFVYSLISIPTNIVNYIGALGMPEPPQEAYARAGVAYTAWPGWRVAVLLIGVAGALIALVMSAAIALGIVDAISANDLDVGGMIGMLVFLLLAWLAPALMIVCAVKRPKVATA